MAITPLEGAHLAIIMFLDQNVPLNKKQPFCYLPNQNLILKVNRKWCFDDAALHQSEALRGFSILHGMNKFTGSTVIHLNLMKWNFEHNIGLGVNTLLTYCWQSPGSSWDWSSPFRSRPSNPSSCKFIGHESMEDEPSGNFNVGTSGQAEIVDLKNRKCDGRFTTWPNYPLLR